MKEMIKKGVCVTLIYLVAIGCTFLFTNRMERLEQAAIEDSEVCSNIK